MKITNDWLKEIPKIKTRNSVCALAILLICFMGSQALQFCPLAYRPILVIITIIFIFFSFLILLIPLKRKSDSRGAVNLNQGIFFISFLLVFSSIILYFLIPDIRDLFHSDPLYESFRKDNKGSIMLSNPPVYKYLNKQDSIGIKRLLGKNIADLKPIEYKNHGIVNLGDARRDTVNGFVFQFLLFSDDQYTGIGEALGLCNIRSFLQEKYHIDLEIHQSRCHSDLPRGNTIILGGWIANKLTTDIIPDARQSYEKYYDNIPYRVCNGRIIKIASTGMKETGYEQLFSKPPSEGIQLINDYAIITKVWNFYDCSKSVIICSGINSQGTEAACRFISTIKGIKKIQEWKPGNLNNWELPEWFQVILNVPVKNGSPIDNDVSIIKIVAIPQF